MTRPQGIRYARAATTANITLSGTQTIDGVSLVVADRVLVKNQTAGENNGIYVVQSGAWERAVDANTELELKGALVFVSEGTANGNKFFAHTTDEPFTLGTTALTFANPATWKNSVRAGTTANVTLSGEQTIDGVSVVANDRVLVKNQDTASENGIYVAASGAWTRATDADESAEMVANMTCVINEGTTLADTLWHLTTNNPVTLGTTELTFAQIGAAASSLLVLHEDKIFTADQATSGYTLNLTGETHETYLIEGRIITNTSDTQQYLIFFWNGGTSGGDTKCAFNAAVDTTPGDSCMGRVSTNGSTGYLHFSATLFTRRVHNSVSQWRGHISQAAARGGISHCSSTFQNTTDEVTSLLFRLRGELGNDRNIKSGSRLTTWRKLRS